MKFAAMLLLLAAMPALSAQGLDVSVEPVVEGKAEPGKEFTFKLHFVVPEGYHAYHKDNPGISMPIEVKWKDLAGLELVSATWPEPTKHKDDFSEEWELGPVFDIAYTFKVPATAKGKLTITGSHITQFCNEEGCLEARGNFVATIEVLQAAPSATPVKPPKKGPPEVKASAAFDPGAKAGGQATLKLTFEYPETYHAYHKDNPGYGEAPKVDWFEPAGLSLKDTTWPEPLIHDIDGTIEWEYASPLTLTYTFDVPADAKGAPTVKGKWSIQVCDPDVCYTRKGEVSAVLALDGPLNERAATDAHGFYLDFDYALEQAKALNKPLLVDFNGRY